MNLWWKYCACNFRLLHFRDGGVIFWYAQGGEESGVGGTDILVLETCPLGPGGLERQNTHTRIEHSTVL